MAEMVRRQFSLPRPLAEEFQRVAGTDNQSEKLAEALVLWLKRQELLRVVETLAGFVTAEDHPEWATADDVNAWVRNLRAEQRAEHVGTEPRSVGQHTAE